MITLSDLVWIGLLLTLLAYWWQARDIKEIAVIAAKRHCAREGLELLDETVVLRRIKLKRGDDGQLHIWRGFLFEFTSTGEERYQGQVVLLGRRVQNIWLPVHRMNG